MATVVKNKMIKMKSGGLASFEKSLDKDSRKAKSTMKKGGKVKMQMGGMLGSLIPGMGGSKAKAPMKKGGTVKSKTKSKK